MYGREKEQYKNILTTIETMFAVFLGGEHFLTLCHIPVKRPNIPNDPLMQGVCVPLRKKESQNGFPCHLASGRDFDVVLLFLKMVTVS